MSLLLQIALTFAILSVASIGGANATLPEIQRQVVVVHHWMDDAAFAQMVAVGQITPGPNVLVVSMIGWFVAGVTGMAVATVAMILPSSIVALLVGRVLAKHASSEAVARSRRALAPIAIGFMLASGYVMSRAAYQGVLSLLIIGSTTALIAGTRISPVWSIFGGALISVVVRRIVA